MSKRRFGEQIWEEIAINNNRTLRIFLFLSFIYSIENRFSKSYKNHLGLAIKEQKKKKERRENRNVKRWHITHI